MTARFWNGVFLIATIAALNVASALAQAFDPRPESTKLDCGLEILIVEDPAAPFACVTTWIRAGSAADASDMPGVANMVRAAFALRAERESGTPHSAGVTDSDTLRDACWFAQVIRPDELEPALAVAARLFQPWDATPDELRHTREAAAASDAERDKTDALTDAAIVRLFGGTPYGHSPAPSLPSLRTLQPDNLGRFARQWFVPSNAIVIVAGPVEPDDVLAAAKIAFADVEWVQPPRLPEIPRDLPQAKPLAPDTANALFHVLSYAPQSLAIAFEAYPLIDGRVVRTRVLLQVLRERLRMRLQTDSATYEIRTRVLALAQSGAAAVILSRIDPKSAVDGPGENWLGAAAEALQSMLEALSIEPVAPAELLNARNAVAAAVNARLLGAATRAESDGRYAAIGGDILLAEYERERILGVTALDIQAEAKRLLDAPAAMATSPAHLAPPGSHAELRLTMPSQDSPVAMAKLPPHLVHQIHHYAIETASPTPFKSVTHLAFGPRGAGAVLVIAANSHATPPVSAKDHQTALARGLMPIAAPRNKEDSPVVAYGCVGTNDQIAVMLEWCARISQRANMTNAQLAIIAADSQAALVDSLHTALGRRVALHALTDEEPAAANPAIRAASAHLNASLLAGTSERFPTDED